MSFFKSIKSALGGSDSEEYDVFGQPTSFVNPFSKDKNVADKERGQDEVDIQLDQHEEYAIDAEFADKAARLMNEHTHAVIDMIKGSWKKEREDLMNMVEEAKKSLEDSKEKMQANEANRRQAQTRANDLSARIAELEAEHDKLDIEKKSLESRLKAMEVRGEDAEELDKKVEELNTTIEDLKRQLEERDAELERRDNMPLPASDAPTIEQLNMQVEQRDELIEHLRSNVAELEGKLDAAAEELKAAEELQKTVEQVEEFKDKKNSEISSLRQQIIDLQKRASEFDELRKAHLVLKEENEVLQKNIEHLEETARQNAEVHNRRSIETGNQIDGLKSQLASAKAVAEDFKKKFNTLSVDGNERAASFAKMTAERDDAKAELKRTQAVLQKKQHDAQAMADAIAEKDHRINAMNRQLEALNRELEALKAGARAAGGFVADQVIQDDPAMGAIDDIDWADDGSMPPHPGEDPRQLSLF